MNHRTDRIVQSSVTQIVPLVGDKTPALAALGCEDGSVFVTVMHDYWPARDDRALALGQAATAEMTLGGDAVRKGCRFGVLWAHVVVPRATIDFADETGLSWRRLEDADQLDPGETECLLGFVFDIDAGFEITIIPIRRHKQTDFGQEHTYYAPAIFEPLPGLILMRTVAENAPVKEYL